MSEKYNKKICWLWLVMSLGVANPKIWELMSKHQTVEEVCRYVQSNDIKKKVVEVQTTKELLVDCITRGINVVCYSDVEYPNSLKDMHNPPSVLFCKGDLSLFNQERLLTVVGTRNPTDYTIRVTSIICDNLVKEDFVLISGSALGVDSIAHICAVNNRKPTISVLACGIDYDYPKGSISLRNDILFNGGLILTEQLPNTPPYRGNFPKRNRILAGLGNGTFITEASLGSGALITANYSYKMGKPIFCIPPADIFNERYLGVAKYIRDGAICVFSHNDIMYEYFGSYPSNVRQTNIIQINDAEKVSESPIFKDEVGFKSNKKVKEIPPKDSIVEKPKSKKLESTERDVEVLFSNLKTVAEKVPQKDKSTLDDKQNLVIQSIKKGYNYLDDISIDTGIDISELFEIITDLELDGIVKSNFGNKYTLI